MRSSSLITLMLLVLVATFSLPHVHEGVASADSQVCLQCQVRETPTEHSLAPVSVLVSLHWFDGARPPATVTLDVERCLDRAPKQGPPAA